MCIEAQRASGAGGWGAVPGNTALLLSGAAAVNAQQKPSACLGSSPSQSWDLREVFIRLGPFMAILYLPDVSKRPANVHKAACRRRSLVCQVTFSTVTQDGSRKFTRKDLRLSSNVCLLFDCFNVVSSLANAPLSVISLLLSACEPSSTSTP